MGLSANSDQNVYRPRKRMMMDNFLGGMMWSFGTLIGGIIIIISAGVFLSKIDLVPIVGGWLRDVVQEAIQAPSQTQKTIRDMNR